MVQGKRKHTSSLTLNTLLSSRLTPVHRRAYALHVLKCSPVFPSSTSSSSSSWICLVCVCSVLAVREERITNRQTNKKTTFPGFASMPFFIFISYYLFIYVCMYFPMGFVRYWSKRSCVLSRFVDRGNAALKKFYSDKTCSFSILECLGGCACVRTCVCFGEGGQTLHACPPAHTTLRKRKLWDVNSVITAQHAQNEQTWSREGRGFALSFSLLPTIKEILFSFKAQRVRLNTA